MADHRDDRPGDPAPPGGRSGLERRARSRDGSGPDAERVAAWLAGDLDEVAARAVEQQVADDPAAADRADAIADVVARLRRVDEPDPPADLAARVRAQLAAAPPQRAVAAHRSAQRPARPRPRWAWAPVSAAAVLALLAVLAVSSVLPLGGGDASRVAESGEAAGSTAMTAQGEGGGGGGDEQESAALESRQLEVVADLGTEEGRARLLADVAGEVAAVPEQDAAAGDDTAAAQEDAGAALDAPPAEPDPAALQGCGDALVPEDGGRLVRVVAGSLADRPVLGAVTQRLDGSLQLVVVDPAAGCEVLAEQTRAAG